MIAVDTNVVVRLLTDDDRQQTRKATALFAANEVYVSKTVLLEIEWVLRFSYELDPEQIDLSLRALLGMPGVVSEEPQQVALALDWFGQGLEFADALHLAGSPSAERFITFDRRLIRRAAAIAGPTVEAP